MGSEHQVTDCVDSLQDGREQQQIQRLNRHAAVCRGIVMQVLEGEKDALYALFKHIERDPRHHGIFILADDAIDSGNFGS